MLAVGQGGGESGGRGVRRRWAPFGDHATCLRHPSGLREPRRPSGLTPGHAQPPGGMWILQKSHDLQLLVCCRVVGLRRHHR